MPVTIRATLAAIFAAVAIWLGITVGLIKLLDWLLSTKQKKYITDKLIIYWDWLDDNRAFEPLRRFQSSEIHLKIVGYITIIYSILLFLFYKLEVVPGLLSVIMFFGAVCASIAIKSLGKYRNWKLNGNSVLLYALRSTIVFAFMVILPIVAVLLLVVAWVVVHEASFTFGELILQVILGFAVGFVSAFATLQIYFWSCSILYVVSILLLMALSPIMRLILVRTIEYDKGPIAAISALLTLLGALAAKLAGE
jgi:hypothetical protein